MQNVAIFLLLAVFRRGFIAQNKSNIVYDVHEYKSGLWNLCWKQKKKRRAKFIRRWPIYFPFIQQMRMQKCHVFCVNTHQHVQSGRQNNFHNPSEHWQSVSKRVHAFLVIMQIQCHRYFLQCKCKFRRTDFRNHSPKWPKIALLADLFLILSFFSYQVFFSRLVFLYFLHRRNLTWFKSPRMQIRFYRCKLTTQSGHFHCGRDNMEKVGPAKAKEPPP